MTYSNSATRALLGAVAAVALGVGAASAASLQISITNTQADDGLYLTPLLTVLHDGSYDGFNVGEAASFGIEEIAEEGRVGAEQGSADAAGHTTGVIASPGGFAGAPVIDPGETASITLSVDPADARYLSFLAMVIPSNDTFIGNDNPFAYEVFDAAGSFTRLGPIDILASDAWDAGTEADNGLGAAFNAAGGVATDTTGTISALADLDFLLGQETADGTTVLSGTGAGARLATITVASVPLPATLPLLLVGLGALARRRR